VSQVDRIRYFISQSWLLIVASFCFGLLLAVTDAALSPRIEQNRIDKLNRLVKTLIPEAEHFKRLDEQIEIETFRGEEEQVTVYEAVAASGESVGWSFNAAGTGFQGEIELVVAVDGDVQTLKGFRCLSSNETPGFGDQIKSTDFRAQFEGAPAGELSLVTTGEREKIDSEIVAITGATVSSQAVVDIINTYVTRVKEQMQKKGLFSDGK
jgi:electron transport complex protein RnfG